MKIAVVSTPVFKMIPPQGTSGYSGLEVIAWQQAKGLAAKGHQVSLVGADGSSCPGVQMICVGPEGRTDERLAYDKYWQHLLQVDVVIDHSWQKWSYCLKSEGKLKAPVLGVCHAPVHTMFNKWPPQYPGFPPVEKGCAVCISEDQRVHFENLFLKPAKTAYNGCDVEFYRSTGAKRSDRFLFLARFSTIKGPDLAIDACLKAGVGLDLVGDTSITNEPELLQRCMEKCDGKQIRLIGPCSRSETVYWLSQAHCLLHPNQRFKEPFGLAPVEAQLCGCPVIAWDNGAMRETVQHGQTGLLVNSMEELENAIGSFAKLPGFIEDRHSIPNRLNCRQWASQFSIQRMVDRYEFLCDEAIKTGGW